MSLNSQALLNALGDKHHAQVPRCQSTPVSQHYSKYQLSEELLIYRLGRK